MAKAWSGTAARSASGPRNGARLPASPSAKGRRASDAAREAEERRRDEEAREEPRDGNQRPEREELPEAERARDVAPEERGHLPVELRASSGRRRRPESRGALRAETSQIAGPSAGSRPHEEEVEGVVSGARCVRPDRGRTRSASLKAPADERLSFSRSPTKRSSRTRLELAGELLRETLPPFGHWRYSPATVQFSFWAARM